MPDFLFEPVSHDAAVDFIKSKPVVSRGVFDQLLPSLKARAFVITGCEVAGVTQRVRDRIADLPAGGDWNAIKKDVASDLSSFMVDQDADLEERDAQVAGASRRAELLIRTHGFQAYQTAAYEVAERQKDVLPYFQYITMEDARVRDTHAALDSLILPQDSPFWRDHYPPWDYGCRCQAVPISQEDHDQVAETDAKREPDDRMILDQTRQRELEMTGRLVRGPNNIANVQSPVAAGKPNPFSWHPGDLRLSLDDLQQRYDPDVFNAFAVWARGQSIEGDSGPTVWEWLKGAPAAPAPQPSVASIASAPVRQSPVSAAIQLTKGLPPALAANLQRTVDLIDQVHDDGKLLPLPVNAKTTKRSNLGEYRTPLHTPWTHGPGIGVKPSGTHPELTFCHEVGHAIDNLALPNTPGVLTFASHTSLELDAWRQAIDASASIKNCRANASGSGGTPKYYRYLLLRHEQFARSYAQYVATKSGDAKLLAQLASTRTDTKQWTTEDFEPIKKALDDVFTARGWI